MPYCRSCGASIKSGVKFCTSCGAPVRVPARAPVKVPVRAPVRKLKAPAREAPVEKPVVVAPPTGKPIMTKSVKYVLVGVVIAVVLGSVTAVILVSSGPQDVGDFKVVYGQAQSPACQKWSLAFQTSKGFETLADALNQTLALPRDVDIVLAETGQVNSWYNPSTYQLVMTYDLMAYFDQTFSGYTDPETRVVGTTLFVFFHELGHGLIHVYDLPITGKEEDAVDQLSILILLGAGGEGENAVLNGALWFYEESQKTHENLPFWDTHSLPQQRYYNILAWVYGSDPQKFSWLVEWGYLPQDRAVYAQDEYQKMYHGWETLLSPYMK